MKENSIKTDFFVYAKKRWIIPHENEKKKWKTCGKRIKIQTHILTQKTLLRKRTKATAAKEIGDKHNFMMMCFSHNLILCLSLFFG